MNINQARVIVTGGQSGLGQACVEALTAKGAQVVSWDIQAGGIFAMSLVKSRLNKP